MKKSIEQKYFEQKDFSTLEIICIVIAVICVPVATFVQGGGPLGLPLLLVSIVALIVSRSSRVSDSVIDKRLATLLEAYQIKLTDTTLVAYDLKEPLVKRRKDGKLMSNICYVTEIDPAAPAGILIKISRIDLILGTVEQSTHILAGEEKAELIQETVRTKNGTKQVAYLQFAGEQGEVRLPINMSDYQTTQIVQRICH